MSPKAIIIGIVITFLLIIVLAVFLTGNQKPEIKTTEYSSSDSDRSIADFQPSSFDFGKIKVSDIKSKEFTLKNTGNKPLQILNINSSCNCTTGQIIYKNFKSKEYGMHARSGFVTEIVPGETTVVNVIYRPYLMPVYGPVQREVYLTTNDPLNQKVVFSVKAFVE